MSRPVPVINIKGVKVKPEKVLHLPAVPQINIISFAVFQVRVDHAQLICRGNAGIQIGTVGLGNITIELGIPGTLVLQTGSEQRVTPVAGIMNGKTGIIDNALQIGLNDFVADARGNGSRASEENPL